MLGWVLPSLYFFFVSLCVCVCVCFVFIDGLVLMWWLLIWGGITNFDRHWKKCGGQKRQIHQESTFFKGEELFVCLFYFSHASLLDLVFFLILDLVYGSFWSPFISTSLLSLSFITVKACSAFLSISILNMFLWWTVFWSPVLYVTTFLFFFSFPSIHHFTISCHIDRV